MRLQIIFAALLAATPLSATEIEPAALTALSGADVYVLGEMHDNPLHHQHQTTATRAIGPRALVFEMITPEAAAGVTPELIADPVAMQEALGWQDLGWPDFEHYHPIFTAAPQARVYGALVPRAQLRRAVMEGAAAILPGFGLEQALPADQQQQRENLQMEAHCNALPPEMLGGMVQAQRLRDAVLAQQVARALQEVGPPVVVITGNGHARHDWGLPAALARVAPQAKVLSLAQFEAAPEDTPPYDLWLVTDPAEREDPCAAFNKPQ